MSPGSDKIKSTMSESRMAGARADGAGWRRGKMPAGCSASRTGRGFDL